MPTRYTQMPKLPGEVVDSVIDCFSSDMKALGICSLVCSEWLHRSRFHLFSTVHLSSWRIRTFSELIRSPACTIAPYVSQIEISGSSRASKGPQCDSVTTVCDALSLIASHQPSFSLRVTSIQLRNFDWTTFDFPDQTTIARNLTRLTSTTRLELHRVVFQDMRSLIRLLDSIPSILHASATNIMFTTYMDHLVSPALPKSLTSLELGPGDEVPAFLRSLAACSGSDAVPGIRSLTLYGLRDEDIGYLSPALRTLRHSLQHLRVVFWEGRTCTAQRACAQVQAEEDLTRGIVLSSLSCLRTVSLEIEDQSRLIDTHTCSPRMAASLPAVLSILASEELEDMEISFRSAAVNVDWSRAADALLSQRPHFGNFNNVRVKLPLFHEDGRLGVKELEEEVRGSMAPLHESRV
ncbi:hypothetical protein DXG03_004380 [Asterophora parasitica]|uniref:Uncharacterized protein n=1 Tax=Asterophora parasitica TaxID=117018 RepID=A0A9P7KFS1_9AGAR|nr:hypothetical protein DXG03_004380 [Asterophora parasitica]